MSSNDFHVRQEHDRLPVLMASIIVAFGLVIMVTGIVVSGAMLASKTGSVTPRPEGPERTAPVQLGLVEQTLIEDTERGVWLRDEQLRALEVYGWVDRSAGVVSIPIEQAMAAVVQRSR